MENTTQFSRTLLNDHVREVINTSWRGRRGSSKRCVYFTLCFYAFCRDDFFIHASARDISNRTGLSLRTVSGSLHALIEDQLIRKRNPRRTGNTLSVLADVYEMIKFQEYTREFADVGETIDSECLLIGNTIGFEQYEYLTWQMHDIFRWKGLGKSCLEMYYDLSQHPESKLTDVSRRTGRALSTIYKCKHRMMDEIIDLTNYEAVSMLSEENHKYSIVEQNFNDIAAILGVDGEHRKWSRRYDQQREGYRRRVTWICQNLGLELDTGYIRSLHRI